MSFVFRKPLIAVAALASLAGSLIGQVEAQTIETEAKQALIIDYNTGAVLFEKNPDQVMPPSSMSKLMTTYMVFERLKEGSLSFDDTFLVSERAWRMQGSKMFTPLGDRIKLHDLMRGIIVQSGNDACIVVAEGLANSEEAFAESMNVKARELGMNASHFTNATGWPDPNHYMTARDLTILARTLISDFPDYYSMFSEREFTFHDIRQGNRNPLLYEFPGADGLKTGHTEAAGYGLTGSVKRGDRRIVLVVNGLPSTKARSEETARLTEWAFREFDNFKLFSAGDVVESAEIWLGEQASVPMVLGEGVEITLNRRARKDMKVAAILDEPVAAPIRKNEVIGKLVITAPGMTTIERPLMAGADVEKLGFFKRIGAAINHVVWGSSAGAMVLK